MSKPYRLHYIPDNASLVIRLVLEEIGAPFDTVLVDRRQNAQDSTAFRALNPNGQIPVLETLQGPIFETAAILLWLSEQHGQLAPAKDDPERAGFLKWLFFASNTLHADLRIVFYAEKYIDPRQADKLRAATHPRLRRHLQLLDAMAKSAPGWFCADHPSVLTYYVACMMRWKALYPAMTDRSWYQLTDTPCLQTLLMKLETRPATRSAILAEGLGANPFTSPVHPTPPEGSAI
ncbi:glutathione S-transferase family protein [Ruegeria sp. HKCCA6837]|uniref:glutathione S-transferase family protein n=1 Tax=Ruegeria sp. HKCCA6837 TaxID=2682989 RepID=UPI00148779D2|nr:glutathione S-transferase family protein [Ruegeria sp. HKCCA6837]